MVIPGFSDTDLTQAEINQIEVAFVSLRSLVESIGRMKTCVEERVVYTSKDFDLFGMEESLKKLLIATLYFGSTQVWSEVPAPPGKRTLVGKFANTQFVLNMWRTSSVVEIIAVDMIHSFQSGSTTVSLAE